MPDDINRHQYWLQLLQAFSFWPWLYLWQQLSAAVAAALNGSVDVTDWQRRLCCHDIQPPSAHPPYDDTVEPHPLIDC